MLLFRMILQSFNVFCFSSGHVWHVFYCRILLILFMFWFFWKRIRQLLLKKKRKAYYDWKVKAVDNVKSFSFEEFGLVTGYLSSINKWMNELTNSDMQEEDKFTFQILHESKNTLSHYIALSSTSTLKYIFSAIVAF